MNRHLKFWQTMILAGFLMANLSFAAWATEGGPAFDPKFNPDAQETAVPSGPPVLNDNSQEQPSAPAQENNQQEEQPSTPGQNDNQQAQPTNPDQSQGPGAGPGAGPGEQPEPEQPAATVRPQRPAEQTFQIPENNYPEGHPLSVPLRPAGLQATILFKDNMAWSQPFIADAWPAESEGGNVVSISIFLQYSFGNVHYRAYTSTNGWTPWVINGQQTAIPADNAPIEAIQIRLSGVAGNEYDVYYAARLTDGTETGWDKNGLTVGTMNQGLALSGFRMAVFRKGEGPSFDLGTPVVSAHADGVQYVDGILRYIHGDGSNYTGWGWIGNQRYYFVDSYPVTGWQYIDGYKYYFGEDGVMLTDLEPVVGNQGPFLIRINKEMNCMTIYTKDGDNGYIIPVKSFLTSCGSDTPLGTFKTPEKYRWRLMIHDVHTQYATRLGAGSPILMHSIIYDKPDTYSLQAYTYNYMSIAESAGCIRLVTADSKWIYDNCPLGTTVEVYNSPVPGPYDRPAISFEIPEAQTWDPTDPNVTPEGIARATAAILARHGY